MSKLKTLVEFVIGVTVLATLIAFLIFISLNKDNSERDKAYQWHKENCPYYQYEKRN